MKTFYLTIICLVVASNVLQAQCKRSEIGIGPGIVQFYHNGDEGIKVKGKTYNNTKVNTILPDETKRKSSFSAPAIYYGYAINRRLKFRASLNYYQETREYNQLYFGRNYDGKFSQLRLATGVSYRLSDCECMKTYIAADVVQYVERANESLQYTGYGEWAKSIDNKGTTYSIGINPAFGIRRPICHNLSVSYEMGAEIKYNAGQFQTVNIICSPMNRLSVNYRF
ncbi:MAG: hypothetical protein JNJ58_14220 [Chitinophagaceae bacterium]|nr:hypothetical protein [Chitinophagaceae bacterium]